MQRLPTVLLHHETRHGCHYDWLLENPQAHCESNTPLWTARTQHPNRHWAALGTWPLQPIAPHRRHYLTYQGPLTHGRGQVRRIDRGWFLPLIWTPHLMVIDLNMLRAQGRITIRRLTPNRYQATLTATPYDA